MLHCFVSFSPFSSQTVSRPDSFVESLLFIPLLVDPFSFHLPPCSDKSSFKLSGSIQLVDARYSVACEDVPRTPSASSANRLVVGSQLSKIPCSASGGKSVKFDDDVFTRNGDHFTCTKNDKVYYFFASADGYWSLTEERYAHLVLRQWTQSLD